MVSQHFSQHFYRINYLVIFLDCNILILPISIPFLIFKSVTISTYSCITNRARNICSISARANLTIYLGGNSVIHALNLSRKYSQTFKSSFISFIMLILKNGLLLQIQFYKLKPEEGHFFPKILERLCQHVDKNAFNC